MFDVDESTCQKVSQWLCGLEGGNQVAIKAEELQEERIKELGSLKQNPRISLILNVNLAVIFAIGLFLYLYFTFHKA